MKTKIFPILLVFLSIVLICTGCSITATMPYSSEDYKNLDWSVDELITHLEDLGFTNINTVHVSDTFDAEQARICRVAIEDVSADSWFTEYKDFEKGDALLTSLEVFVSAYRYIPTLTIENCQEFADFVQMNPSEEKNNAIASFKSSHLGEFLEFNGTISSWNDKYWYAGKHSFSVVVEDNDQTEFGWSVYMSELKLQGKYSHEKYTEGLIHEGMQVHMIVQIVRENDELCLKIIDMDIIE